MVQRVGSGRHDGEDDETHRHDGETDELQSPVTDAVHSLDRQEVAGDGEDDEHAERPQQLRLQAWRVGFTSFKMAGSESVFP